MARSLDKANRVDAPMLLTCHIQQVSGIIVSLKTTKKRNVARSVADFALQEQPEDNLMVAISLAWYNNGSYTMAIEPVKYLELHFKMIQFLIKPYTSAKNCFEQKMEMLSNFSNYYYYSSISLKCQPSPTAKPRPLWVRGRRRLTFQTIHGLLFPGLETLLKKYNEK